MLQDVARVCPAPSQHLTTRSSNVARCRVEMLRAFGVSKLYFFLWQERLVQLLVDQLGPLLTGITGQLAVGRILSCRD